MGKKISTTLNMNLDIAEADILDRFRMATIRFGDTVEGKILEWAKQYVDEREHLLGRGSVVGGKQLKALVKRKLGIDLTKANMYDYRLKWVEGNWYWKTKIRERYQYTYDLSKVWPWLIEHYRKIGRVIPDGGDRIPKLHKTLRRSEEVPAHRESDAEGPVVEGFRPIGWQGE